MSNAYDRMKDAIVARIDEQIKTTREQNEALTPMTSHAADADKIAMQIMYSNAFLKAMKLAAGIVLEEYTRLTEVKKPEAAPIRHAPYSTKHRGQDPKTQQ